MSYRRDDSRGFAGRLFDRLSQRFGSDGVFMDVDSVEAGLDFVDAIETAVGSCHVLLAVIGPSWITAADVRGRRLDDPDDLVVVEIRTALLRGIRVIPVLVDDAVMPRSDELPPTLRVLARRNALRLDHESFARDVELIVDVLERVLAAVAPTLPLGPTTRPEPAGEPGPPSAGPGPERWQPPVTTSSSARHSAQTGALWRAVLSRTRTRTTRTLHIRLLGGAVDHTIVASYTSMRDSLVVDGRRAASSFNDIVGSYPFILGGEARDLTGAVTLASEETPGSSVLSQYTVTRLIVDGQDVPCTWVPGSS